MSIKAILDCKEYYECHITLEPHPELEKSLPMPWKFSQIDGDPVLGKKVLAYATRYYSTAETKEFVIGDMAEIASILTSKGFTVVRQKVELVVYDTKKKL